MTHRSQRKLLTASSGNRELSMPGQPAWMIWVVSFGVWTFITLADAGSIYELYRSTGGSMSFPNVLGMECSQILTYFPLTPFVFALAIALPSSTRQLDAAFAIVSCGRPQFFGCTHNPARLDSLCVLRCADSWLGLPPLGFASPCV